MKNVESVEACRWRIEVSVLLLKPLLEFRITRSSESILRLWSPWTQGLVLSNKWVFGVKGRPADMRAINDWHGGWDECRDKKCPMSYSSEQVFCPDGLWVVEGQEGTPGANVFTGYRWNCTTAVNAGAAALIYRTIKLLFFLFFWIGTNLPKSKSTWDSSRKLKPISHSISSIFFPLSFQLRHIAPWLWGCNCLPWLTEAWLLKARTVGRASQQEVSHSPGSSTMLALLYWFNNYITALKGPMSITTDEGLIRLVDGQSERGNPTPSKLNLYLLSDPWIKAGREINTCLGA